MLMYMRWNAGVHCMRYCYWVWVWTSAISLTLASQSRESRTRIQTPILYTENTKRLVYLFQWINSWTERLVDNFRRLVFSVYAYSVWWYSESLYRIVSYHKVSSFFYRNNIVYDCYQRCDSQRTLPCQYYGEANLFAILYVIRRHTEAMISIF